MSKQTSAAPKTQSSNWTDDELCHIGLFEIARAAASDMITAMTSNANNLRAALTEITDLSICIDQATKSTTIAQADINKITVPLWGLIQSLDDLPAGYLKKWYPFDYPPVPSYSEPSYNVDDLPYELAIAEPIADHLENYFGNRYNDGTPIKQAVAYGMIDGALMCGPRLAYGAVMAHTNYLDRMLARLVTDPKSRLVLLAQYFHLTRDRAINPDDKRPIKCPKPVANIMLQASGICDKPFYAKYKLNMSGHAATKDICDTTSGMVKHAIWSALIMKNVNMMKGTPRGKAEAQTTALMTSLAQRWEDTKPKLEPFNKTS